MTPSKYITRFFLFLLSLLFVACGEDTTDDNTPTTPDSTEGPKVVSIQPAADAAVNVGTAHFVITYDDDITLLSSKRSLITLNDKPVAKAAVNTRYLNILEVDATVPEDADKATLHIPAGTINILGHAERVNADYTQTWKVEKKSASDPDGPVATDIAKTLCDADANADATALYDQLLGYYGKTMISGIMCDVAWNHKTADEVQKWIGKRPVLNGYDYIHLAWSPANWIDYTNLTPVTEWTKDGGIVACMYHFNVPASEATVPANEKDQKNLEKMTCTPEKTTFKARNCFVDGTWEKAFYDRQINKLIDQLKLLQDAHVAVLWRPYHEAKGNTGLYNGSGKAWFWWGTDGPDVFKHLWLDMYERFQQAGLHNLIWVFTDSTDNLSLDWYPGDEYVDIVGADVYNKKTAVACANVFKGLEQAYPHKMIALSECGNVADMQSQWNAGARWLWFMPWYGGGDTPHYTESWWKQAAAGQNVLMR